MAEQSSINAVPDKDIENNKVIAAISYLWILCLVPLFLKRSSKFAQFHAKQGLMLFIVEIIGVLIYFIPVIGLLLFIITLILAVMGIMSAMQGKYWEMPILGKYAKTINLDIK
jgi:fumarate reductase subunit D